MEKYLFSIVFRLFNSSESGWAGMSWDLVHDHGFSGLRLRGSSNDGVKELSGVDEGLMLTLLVFSLHSGFRNAHKSGKENNGKDEDVELHQDYMNYKLEMLIRNNPLAYFTR